MIEQGEILTLEDDKEYVVAASTILEGVNYVYLMNLNDYNDFMYCAFDDKDGLYEVEDSALLEKLLILFNDQLKDYKVED